MDHAKFWFRLHRLTISVCFACLSGWFLAAPAAAQQHGRLLRQAVNDLPDAFANFLESVSSFKARFVQELWSDDQRLIEVAEGDVELLRPGRFRWHYDQPWEQLIIADGETLWMYDIDISQVTRSALAANDAGNPAALLSGDSDIMENFAVIGNGSDNDEVWVTLAPKAAQSDYSSVRVAFNRHSSDNELRALEFVDGLNQTTVIRFHDAELNPAIDPARFQFEIPVGAHVLGGPG